MGFEYSEQKKTEKQNNTGIPDNMKKRFEEFSAVSFDDVRVHYNSEKPAKLNALAYTKGTQVYIAPGQDKHLPHELGHVVQQKQGRVKPTGKINGVPVNEDTNLEREADNFLSGGCRHNNITGKGAGAMDAPVQMVKGEADSVFDFEKLKEFIKKLIDINIHRRRTAWIGEELDEKKLDSYTERVQTLLEDIRQVDLQFLAVTAASFEEEGLLEDEASFKDILKAEEKTGFGDKAALQNKYKNIIDQKLKYMKRIKEQLEAQCNEARCNEAHRQYLIAVANHGRAKKPKKVRGMKRVMDRLKHKEEQMYIQRNYLADVEKQIKILETILENGEQKGYVFNLNALLMETDDKIRFYMAIVAPSKIDRFKDISMDEEGKLTSYSGQMQLGIGTPVRSFSWYLKYLMDPSAAANNTPLIRVVDTPELYLQNWHQNAISEALKKDDISSPMNEDQKVPNQFGTPASSDDFKTLLEEASELITIGEKASIPERLTDGSGKFEELEQFKSDIGFERVRSGVRTPTDVHFFDFEHTAFHSMDDKGAPKLYSPMEAKEEFVRYSKLMEALIARTGRDNYVDVAVKKGIIRHLMSDYELRDKITIILEANHCIPEGRRYDLHGNLQEALESERKFASDYIKEVTVEDSGEILLSLTKDRYKKWCVQTNRKPVSKKYPVMRNGGVLYELQELHKISGSHIFIELPEADNTEAFFETLKATFENSQEGKLHVIALCFKILRLIKDSQVENGKRQRQAEQYDYLERDLFAARSSGDYFDVLNRHERKEIMIGEETVSIPYDKMTSTGRFMPENGEPQYESIPFIGGASGTTRDISKDLLSKKMLEDEEEYWKFQMLNASFMILYSYHSFTEVIYKAAVTRIEYYGQERISRRIIRYLKNLNRMGYMPDNESILADIKEII